MQIQANAMEDAREYQDEQIDKLTDQLGATYSRTFMHAPMIAHWAMMFQEPISTMVTNFSTTLSITIPALANIAPPLIFPVASEYPPSNDDWEVQSVESAPTIPIPPP